MRWVATATIPLWLVTLFLHHSYALDSFVPASQSLGLSPQAGPLLLLTIPISIAVAGMSVLLIWPRSSVSFRRARSMVFLVSACVLTGEGLQVAFAPAPEANQLPSFVFACMLIFILAPLNRVQFLLLGSWVLILPVSILVLISHTDDAHGFIASLSLPLAAIVIGILVNNWNLRNFRLRTLSELRLRRRTAELERRRQEADIQKKLAQQQHEEAERQRQRAMNLLSGALTAPVARSYERHGFIKPFTQTVVVIFCDAVNFSDTCKNLQPERVVSEMRRLWIEFDRACLGLGMDVEPLRAEGDARLAVAGLDFDGTGESTHQAAIAATLSMLRFKKALPQPNATQSDETKVLWPMRIGINIGTVTAGVIDTSSVTNDRKERNWGSHSGRLWFDVWGDAVVMAARLAQAAAPNQILVPEKLLWETGGLFDYGPIHAVKSKNTDIPNCAEIRCLGAAFTDGNEKPNQAFWEIFNASDYRPIRPSRQGSTSKSISEG